VLDRLRTRDRPGGYATHRHRELRRQWQRRVFPRWPLYVGVSAFTLVIIGTLLPNPYKTFLMVGAACVVAGWWFGREALVPDHIERWQRGAWGEEDTAKVLKPLQQQGWTVRHDLPSRFGNRDHVVLGPRLFLLESKNFYDSEVSLEGEALRVRRIDQPEDSYLLDQLTVQMEQRARHLWNELRQSTGLRAYVHPVVVLWARFPEKRASVRGVTYLDGDELVGWLEEQPPEFSDARRTQLASWLESLPGTPRRSRFGWRGRGRDAAAARAERPVHENA
jgi:Nuclease-related domain